MNVYKKIASEDGSYRDADGTRWDILQAKAATGSGWEPYPNPEAALSSWGLVPVQQTKETPI